MTEFRTKHDQGALNAFQQQLVELMPLRAKGLDHPHFSRWKMTTTEVFKRFLPGSSYLLQFRNIRFRVDTNQHYQMGVDPDNYFKSACDQAQSCLEAAIEHIRRFGTGDDAIELIEEMEEIEVEEPYGSDAPINLDKIPRKDELLAFLKQRLAAGELIAMLFIDLDGFKQVNDQLGHHEGDKCLVKVATMIREAAVGKGKLFRPGGDEFVVVLPNFTRHEAAATAERIRTAIETGNPGGTKKVTASIGVTDSELAKDAATLYKRADDAMYVAKHDRKKNCVVVDDGSEIRKRAEGQI